ncbi:MAG: phage integrase N-terminal SAM-like domain-containing protein, partial [Oscillospiraceae bacterium]|nr:phage integrase N-terminal SAM-like domain-containing protein [Oscillospiraceae bacterium]
MSSQKINPKECPRYLNEFFTFQRVVKIKSERTLESYYIDLRIFLRYVKLTKGEIRPDTPMRDITISDIPIEWVRDFSKLDILNYLSYVATDRGNTAKTRHRKLASLKVFYKCLYRDLNLIPSDPTKDIDYPKMHEHLP